MKYSMLIGVMLLTIQVACAGIGDGPTYGEGQVPKGMSHFPRPPVQRSAPKPCDPILNENDSDEVVAIKIGVAYALGENSAWGRDYVSYAERFRPGWLQAEIEHLRECERTGYNYPANSTRGIAQAALREIRSGNY